MDTGKWRMADAYPVDYLNSGESMRGAKMGEVKKLNLSLSHIS